MVIRPAEPSDVPAITAIYAHHVLHGTGTFEEEAPDAAEMQRRFDSIRGRGWPWLVADAGGAVVGYAYAGIFRDRSAYRFSAEDSVYVAAGQLGQGIGAALLDALLAAAAKADFQRMFAVIGDAANTGSIRLHERAGFTHAGRLEGAGFKFGRLLDVIFMQRTL